MYVIEKQKKRGKEERKRRKKNKEWEKKLKRERLVGHVSGKQDWRCGMNQKSN